MEIYTKWVCYDGQVGVTESGVYYEISTGIKMKREYYQSAIYYRARSSTKRYSWLKCNRTKSLKIINIKTLNYK